MKNAYKTSNQIFSCKAPLVLPVELDFSSETEQLVDFSSQLQLGVIDFISTVWVDLIDSAIDVEIQANLVGQRIKALAGTQGYYPLMVGSSPKLTVTVSATQATPLKLIFSNIPYMPIVFGASSGGGSGGDVNINEIGGNAVTDFLPVKEQANPLAYTDISIASLSGASEQLAAANASRRLLIVNNVGAADIAINLAGGAAAIDTAGSITLGAGGTLVLDKNVPSGAINVIGTATESVTAYEA